MRFKYAPNETFSTVLSNGEEVRVKANANGIIEPKDEELAALLDSLAALPDHPIRAVKGS